MPVVIDASAMVELLLRTSVGGAVGRLLRRRAVAAPSHLDAEVLSALGRLHRASEVSEGRVGSALEALARAPITRYLLAPLLEEAWGARDTLALPDALYVVLARRLGANLVTTDARLAAAPGLGISVTVARG
ncbi:MAG: type II toxin-antitoxin system VapC family toxin [Acidimicrobiia bacterium]